MLVMLFHASLAVSSFNPLPQFWNMLVHGCAAVFDWLKNDCVLFHHCCCISCACFTCSANGLLFVMNGLFCMNGLFVTNGLFAKGLLAVNGFEKFWKFPI